jgi:predicted DNA-binding transcriptional regulator YafY
MMRIHEWIKSGRLPNCVGMAKDLGVSRQTVKRDVEFMADRLNLPIAYDARRYGFFYTRPVDRFPALPITEAEVFATLIAHKPIAQYQGTPFQKPLAMVFRKLTGQLDTRDRYSLDNLGEGLSFRPFAPEDTDLRMFQTITRGRHERRALTFQYKNLGAKQLQARKVHLYHFACLENHWYLFSFDTYRDAMRSFALTRLTDPKLTDERFEVPKNFDPDEYPRQFLDVQGHR